MQSIKDLFGTERFIKPSGKLLSERGALIGYFAKAFDRDPQYTGVRLAHYTLDDLYGLKSAYEDRARKNSLGAIKYLWKITETERVYPHP